MEITITELKAIVARASKGEPLETAIDRGIEDAQKSQPTQAIISLPTKGTTPYVVTKEHIEEWKKDAGIPIDVDFDYYLKEMLEWLEAQPKSKKKTHRGMGNFCKGWIKRAVERSYGKYKRAGNAPVSDPWMDAARS